jgi:hypothetical protein
LKATSAAVTAFDPATIINEASKNFRMVRPSFFDSQI